MRAPLNRVAASRAEDLAGLIYGKTAEAAHKLAQSTTLKGIRNKINRKIFTPSIFKDIEKCHFLPN